MLSHADVILSYSDINRGGARSVASSQHQAMLTPRTVNGTDIYSAIIHHGLVNIIMVTFLGRCCSAISCLDTCTRMIRMMDISRISTKKLTVTDVRQLTIQDGTH